MEMPVTFPAGRLSQYRIDKSGIGGEIPNLRVGASIVIKGEFIPEDEAYKTPHNCCDALFISPMTRSDMFNMTG